VSWIPDAHIGQTENVSEMLGLSLSYKFYIRSAFGDGGQILPLQNSNVSAIQD
jgi:hypothetical protein